MTDCECLEKCPFFHDKMENMPSMAGMLKQRYCQGEWGLCARHRVFCALGRSAVPTDLFPNQVERVDEIISAGSLA